MPASIFLPLAPVRAIAQWGGTASVSATTDEEILATVLVPAGSLGATGRLQVDSTWVMTGSTNAKTLRVRVGVVGSGLNGDAIQAPAIATTATLAGRQCFGFQNLTATSQVTTNGQGPSGGFGNSTSSVSDLTLDTTAIVEVNITGQKATGSETLSLRAYAVTVALV